MGVVRLAVVSDMPLACFVQLAGLAGDSGSEGVGCFVAFCRMDTRLANAMGRWWNLYSSNKDFVVWDVIPLAFSLCL